MMKTQNTLFADLNNRATNLVSTFKVGLGHEVKIFNVEHKAGVNLSRVVLVGGNNDVDKDPLMFIDVFFENYVDFNRHVEEVLNPKYEYFSDKIKFDEERHFCVGGLPWLLVTLKKDEYSLRGVIIKAPVFVNLEALSSEDYILKDAVLTYPASDYKTSEPWPHFPTGEFPLVWNKTDDQLTIEVAAGGEDDDESGIATGFALQTKDIDSDSMVCMNFTAGTYDEAKKFANNLATCANRSLPHLFAYALDQKEHLFKADNADKGYIDLQDMYDKIWFEVI